MQRPIVIYPDPILLSKAAEVARVDGDVRGLVKDMFETMYAAEGVGLAAPQVGVGRRVIVVDVSPVEKEHGPMALINPLVVEGKGSVEGKEGCLSLPGVEGMVPRFERIVVTGRNERGEPVRIEASGFLARALQHEIDHLEGILFIDRLSSSAASAR
jgi:peptide deformylase